MIRVPDEILPAHPSVAGHFPGNPIVPGVLLLSRMFRAATAAFGEDVVALPAVKFLASLVPGERFEFEFERADAGPVVKFRVLRGATLIAAGALRLRTGGVTGLQ